MEVQGLLGDAVESGEATLGVAPEGFGTVDVILPPGKFIGAMVDPGMLLVWAWFR